MFIKALIIVAVILSMGVVLGNAAYETIIHTQVTRLLGM